jgi:hypothetical protein
VNLSDARWKFAGTERRVTCTLWSLAALKRFSAPPRHYPIYTQAALTFFILTIGIIGLYIDYSELLPRATFAQKMMSTFGAIAIMAVGGTAAVGLHAFLLRTIRGNATEEPLGE